jgi:hypothetical protein
MSRESVLAEVAKARDAARAQLPVDADWPPADSWLWWLGICRVAGWLVTGHRTLLETRRVGLQLAAIGVALVERVDRELQGEPPAEASRRPGSPE